MNILKDISQEVQDYQTKQVQIIPGLFYNQYETINQIIFYWNSKYVTGETDDEGDRKFFYNINKNPAKVFSKAIDFDTKNIRLLTAEGGDSLKTWFMERDLKHWMRDVQFGRILNRIFVDLPVFGSVVLKIIDGAPHFVDLRNFAIDPQANSIPEANYVIEVHHYSIPEFKQAAKKMNWDKKDVEETISLYRQMKNPQSHIRVYERYGEVENNGKYEYRRVFHADVGDDQYDQHGTFIQEHKGVELDSDPFSPEELEKLYWEFHSFKIFGRWLGIGVVEELFEPQIAENQNTNLQNKSAFWAALKLFQTRDTSVNRNLMTDTRNGEILNVESEITPINMASSENLAFFNQQDIKWLRNRDELTFSYDVIQGERLPAGTPLGSAQLAVTQTLSYFEQIQENIAMDVKEMLYKVIFPQFQKENTQEHTLRLVGKDLETYIGMVKNDLILKEIIRQVVKGKNLPTPEEKDALEIVITESLKRDKEKLLKIPKNFYKDTKYDVDIDITGESIDTRVRQATIFAILQAITSDPTMLQDPQKRRILFMIAENGGINPNELFEVEKKEIGDITQLAPPQGTAGGRAGGGVSAANLGQPVQGRATQTV